MTDNDIYNIYGKYNIVDIVWKGSNHGEIILRFPGVASDKYRVIQLREELAVDFRINTNNVVILNKRLPEFVLKDVVDFIRERKENKDNYLWGV